MTSNHDTSYNSQMLNFSPPNNLLIKQLQICDDSPNEFPECPESPHFIKITTLKERRQVQKIEGMKMKCRARTKENQPNGSFYEHSNALCCENKGFQQPSSDYKRSRNIRKIQAINFSVTTDSLNQTDSKIKNMENEWDSIKKNHNFDNRSKSASPIQLDEVDDRIKFDSKKEVLNKVSLLVPKEQLINSLETPFDKSPFQFSTSDIRAKSQNKPACEIPGLQLIHQRKKIKKGPNEVRDVINKVQKDIATKKNSKNKDYTPQKLKIYQNFNASSGFQSKGNQNSPRSGILSNRSNVKENNQSKALDLSKANNLIKINNKSSPQTKLNIVSKNTTNILKSLNSKKTVFCQSQTKKNNFDSPANNTPQFSETKDRSNYAEIFKTYQQMRQELRRNDKSHDISLASTYSRSNQNHSQEPYPKPLLKQKMQILTKPTHNDEYSLSPRNYVNNSFTTPKLNKQNNRIGSQNIKENQGNINLYSEKRNATNLVKQKQNQPKKRKFTKKSKNIKTKRQK